MDRNELLNYVLEIKKNIESIETNDKEYKSYYKPLITKGKYHLMFGVFPSIILSIILSYKEFARENILFLITIVQTTTIVFLGIYFIIYKIINTVHSKYSLSKSRQRMNQLLNMNIVHLDKIKKQNVIPEVYCHHHALKHFEQYFSTGRADTLKEAMNLYEQEVRHEKQMKELSVMKKLQEDTYKEAKAAAILGLF